MLSLLLLAASADAAPTWLPCYREMNSLLVPHLEGPPPARDGARPRLYPPAPALRLRENERRPLPPLAWEAVRAWDKAWTTHTRDPCPNPTRVRENCALSGASAGGGDDSPPPLSACSTRRRHRKAFGIHQRPLNAWWMGPTRPLTPRCRVTASPAAPFAACSTTC